MVLRHIQVCADEDALVLHLALGNEIGEAEHVHGGLVEVKVGR
jgi:hypothetical protein